ncbi:hypothetical protein BT69DRAFT_1338371 [Atractiella rhizophila]|nr:hypothetical protein BT69DRAFT_1338371 [Atractiella rhizophila]
MPNYVYVEEEGGGCVEECGAVEKVEDRVEGGPEVGSARSAQRKGTCKGGGIDAQRPVSPTVTIQPLLIRAPPTPIPPSPSPQAPATAWSTSQPPRTGERGERVAVTTVSLASQAPNAADTAGALSTLARAAASPRPPLAPAKPLAVAARQLDT